MTDSIVLRARGLRKVYDGGSVVALDGVDLDLGEGEFVSILGPSGSGKSTLLHLIGALDRPDAGTIELDGIELTSARRLDRIRAEKLGFVFQLHNLLPTLTALENVEIPLAAGALDRHQRRERAAELLDAVGLADRASHRPGQLSGGQRQRVAIARGLANRPRVLLADEPTGNLDQASGLEVLELFQRVSREEGTTLCLVTHDPAIAGRADRRVHVVDGRIVEEQE